MPQLIETYRVPSPKIYGEDSWVDFAYLSFQEATSRDTSGTKEEKGARAVEFVRAHIVDWNWVNKAGEKLEIATVDFDQMQIRQRNFLFDGLFEQNEDEDERKNS